MVSPREEAGEGDAPRTELSKIAPHPNPLSRSRMFPTSAALISGRTRAGPRSAVNGERERTEFAGANLNLKECTTC